MANNRHDRVHAQRKNDKNLLECDAGIVFDMNPPNCECGWGIFVNERINTMLGC